MPIYEFECKGCGEVFEHFLHVNDAIEDVVCTHCGSKEIKKVISPFGFRTRQRVKGDYKPDPECVNDTCVPQDRPKPFGWGSKNYKPGQYLKELPRFKKKTQIGT
jgi:putative FmdB family regulatory protein